MNVAVIVPFGGKQRYQAAYDALIAAIEHTGHRVISPEKSQDYQTALAADSGLRDEAKAHYEFMRKSIIDSDAVVVEASYEDFRVGHETTLALLYRKPVLALSQELDLGRHIHHPGFYGVTYRPSELPGIIKTFLAGVQLQYTASASGHPLRRAPVTSPAPAAQRTIAVFGGVYADIFNRVAEIPAADEVALSSAFKISLGGKATNAAVAMARMGAQVLLCGRLGHDVVGTDLESILIREGIKTDFLPRDATIATGTVTLAVDDHAKYSTIVHEAANIHITKEAVDGLFADVDEGHLRLDCLYLTLEPQAEMVKYIIEEAARRQVFVFCDAAPHARPLDLKLLPLIDIIAPNQIETHAMTGIDVQDTASAQAACEFLASRGAQKVIITVGEKGAYYYEHGRLTAISAIPVKAIDEAGAGDAFRAAFVIEYLQSASTHQALDKGRAAGAYAVTHFGSYDSMPTSRQLRALVKQTG